jgi:hypothetical protein
MDIAVKYGLILVIMAISMGILAGFLVRAFDFTPYRTGLLIVIVVLAVLVLVLIYIANKRGRLRTMGLGE